MTNFIIIITYLLIGLILRKIPDFPENTAKTLNQFAIYVSMPALILLRLPHLALSREIMTPLVMPWFALLLSALLIWLLSRIFRWQRNVTGCLLLLVPLGNTSFFGIPMVRAFFGEQGIAYALLYDQFGSFLALASYGAAILSIYSSHQTQLHVRYIVKRIIVFPPFIALILAILSQGVPFPDALNSLLSTLAGTLIPLVMIAVGMQLRLRLSRESTLHLVLGLSIKLVVIPIAALLVCRGFGLEGESVRVSIFEAGMPPMITAGALAVSADLSSDLAAAMVGIGMVASFATLPLIYQML